jgi:hypothetical protein
VCVRQLRCWYPSESANSRGNLSKAKTGAYLFENLQKKKPKQQASDALSIPIDILLSSLLVGASTALFLTDEVKMQKNDLANIPLVKGRSLVSEELCSDFIR